MKALKRIRPIWIVFGLLALCAIAWAVAELSGQANKTAADAGRSSTDLTLASLDTIKPSQKAPPCDWKLERSLKQQLDAMGSSHKQIENKARSEAASTGQVSEATRIELLSSATEFKNVSDQYADMWMACNCLTRANLAREAGQNMVAGAEVIAYGADASRADALKTQQARLNEARSAYTKEAVDNKELSAADKAAIKTSVVPRAQQLVTDTTSLVSELTGLLDNVRSQATPAGLVSGLGGCASGGGAASGGDVAASLISPVSSLLSLAEGLLTNAQSLLSDATMLSQ